MRGRRIRIRFQNGTAEIAGEVASRGEWDTVTRVAGTVPGVERVNNRMTTIADASVRQVDPRQVDPRMVDPRYSQRPVDPRFIQRQVDPRFAGRQVPFQGRPGAPVVPVGYQQPPAPGGAPAAPPGEGWTPPEGAMPPMPSYGHGGGGMYPYQSYSMPNMPEYAWPSQASYPNSAQISYPTQYSASAWPYIGPFYPYPQVPLGWREAQLEWDDGYWHLNFRPRTSKWFWFVNPKNW